MEKSELVLSQFAAISSSLSLPSLVSGTPQQEIARTLLEFGVGWFVFAGNLGRFLAERRRKIQKPKSKRKRRPH